MTFFLPPIGALRGTRKVFFEVRKKHIFGALSENADTSLKFALDLLRQKENSLRVTYARASLYIKSVQLCGLIYAV